ncbi:hypothetical protein M404DRAFT_31716 [Pisolithus tinctorius Marx 270]|uniref:Uncharacterized protein n=1 Tax=Pisolithus tinctorius Marx 270 TaxID=870435 RepID=A0A0C3NRW3_PISTI|nr:hypothetical protein M404DRAFT_31716 [Pisolithus tinctorius Marx 270]
MHFLERIGHISAFIAFFGLNPSALESSESPLSNASHTSPTLQCFCPSLYTFYAICNHNSHRLCREKVKEYNKAIQEVKKSHWRDWLEEAGSKDLWKANRYISKTYGNGSKARIPTLKKTNKDSTTTMTNSNEDKSQLFMKTLFPPPPPHSLVPQDYKYSDQAE